MQSEIFTLEKNMNRFKWTLCFLGLIALFVLMTPADARAQDGGGWPCCGKDSIIIIQIDPDAYPSGDEYIIIDEIPDPSAAPSDSEFADATAEEPSATIPDFRLDPRQR